MNAPRSFLKAQRREAGYALLMVVFLSAALLITAVAAAPNLLTQGTREREEELVWRGGQYARAVRLYYRKYGRFPQSLDDLTQEKNNLRFLRKPYTDPMNREDGSWRLIYLSPTGQLIGSVKPRFLGGLTGVLVAQPAPGQPFTPLVAAPQGTAQPAQVPPGQSAAPPPPAPSTTGLEGKVFGGNIIGVGSKVNRRSFRVYDGGTTYREWEFIWDPTKEVVAVGQPAAPGAPVGNPPTPPPQLMNPPLNPPVGPPPRPQ
jgi:type II secretory pathway pseudopilin PulG